MSAKPSSNQGHEKLIPVFDTMEESEALVVRGLLESSGIPALITAIDAPLDVLPGVGGVVVRVPPDRAEDARNLIYEQHRAAASQAEAESDTDNPKSEDL
jgi:hypothetical protein